MRLLAFFSILFLPSIFVAQNYPQSYFVAPLKIDLALSGTFGELRGNHYHSGIDIKTQGKQGLPVLASAAGKVVRIKVSAYGYGNALYVAHPNGYTTVYGHLQRFTPAIAAWVKKQQYANQQFEVDLFPPAIFNFQQGEVIAYSGNSGGSGGPHLHFEIRDSKTEETINPLLFGLPVSDSRKPLVKQLYATPLGKNAQINGNSAQQQVSLVAAGNGVYKASFTASGDIGLVLNTIDQQDLSNNSNGIFTINQRVNDTINYTFRAEKFSFSKTRYINAHMDFSRYIRYRQLTHKCYLEPGDFFGYYQNVSNRGIISIKPNQIKQVVLEIFDVAGNKTEIQLTVKGVAPTATEALQSNAKSAPFGQAQSIKLDAVSVHIPANTLYADADLSLTKEGRCAVCASDIYVLGEPTLAAHKRYDLRMHRSALPASDKYVWAILNGNSPKSGLTTTWQGDWLVAHPREFGRFAVVEDTVPPAIKVQNFNNGKLVKSGEDLVLTATDNLSGITKYRATIDGKWVLLEHDAKRNRYWHTFDAELLTAGSHTISIIMEDEVGNTATWQSVFTY